MLECNIIDRPYFNGHIVLTKAKIGRDLWVLCEYDPGTPFNRKYYFDQGSTDSSVGRSSDLIARSRKLSWESVGLLIARSRVRSSTGARCCVLEQDTSSPLLSTGLTQEAALKASIKQTKILNKKYNFGWLKWSFFLSNFLFFFNLGPSAGCGGYISPSLTAHIICKSFLKYK